MSEQAEFSAHRPDLTPDVVIEADGRITTTWPSGKRPNMVVMTTALFEGMVNRQNSLTQQLTATKDALTESLKANRKLVQEAYQKGVERGLSGD